MQSDAQRLTLLLANPFTLSYGTTTVRENVLVRVHDGAFAGVGEAAVVPYYGETPDRVLGYFSDPACVEALGKADALLLDDALDSLPPGPSSAAHAALDMALHDLWGQRLGHPLYRLWGLNPRRVPLSSFTVAMSDDESDFRARLQAVRGFDVIKLKLGGADWRTDLERVKLARSAVTARLCVDANGGWAADDALLMIPELAALGVIFIEQPVARDDLAGWQMLHAALPADRPPLIADESVQGVDSVSALVGLVDGINIKLAKCGGLRAARQMVLLARAYGLRILIGCMVESSVAVTAAAHLAPLADYIDLDGNLLITNDPYRGVQIVNGRPLLPDAPGLGVKPVDA